MLRKTIATIRRERDAYSQLIIFGIIFFLIGISYSGFECLQSTINVQSGLGTTSIGTLYLSAIITSLFLAPTIVSRLTPKGTLLLTWSSYAVYAVANVYPCWLTLVPASLFVGVTFAISNIVIGIYIDQWADDARELAGHDVDSTRQKENKFVHFNSILIAFINAGPIVGSLIGSLVVGSASVDSASDYHGNQTTPDNNFTRRNTDLVEKNDDLSEATTIARQVHGGNPTASQQHLPACGVNHCPFIEEHVQSFSSPEPHLVYILAVVFLACIFIAIGLTFLLKPLPSDRPCCSSRRSRDGTGKSDDDEERVSMKTRITETFRLLSDVRLVLLIPAITLPGIIKSFAVGAFNQSFIACALGIGMIGYGSFCYRASLIMSSLLAGQLIHCLHRRTIILSAILLNVAIVSSWFAWVQSPSADLPLILFWCALNGTVNGLLKTTIYGLFPTFFGSRLTYALTLASLWESLGTAVTFFVNDHLCFGIKAYAVLAVTVVTAVTYVTAERVEYCDRSDKRRCGVTSAGNDVDCDGDQRNSCELSSMTVGTVAQPE